MLKKRFSSSLIIDYNILYLCKYSESKYRYNIVDYTNIIYINISITLLVINR